METYTPTPTQLIDVSLPQAGVDPVGVSTVRVGMEAAADGIAFNSLAQNRPVFRANFEKGAAISGGDFPPIDTGSSFGNGFTTLVVDSGIGLGSHAIQIGSGTIGNVYKGLLRIGVRGVFTLNTTDNPADMPLFNVWRHDGVSDPDDGEVVANLYGQRRGNTSAGATILVDDSVILEITTADLFPRFSLQWNGGYDLTFVNAATQHSYFYIEQVWRDIP